MPSEVDDILRVLEPLTGSHALGVPLRNLRREKKFAEDMNADHIVWLFGDNLREAVAQNRDQLHDLHTRICRYVTRRDASRAELEAIEAE